MSVWDFVVENIEPITRIGSIAAAAFGAIALLLTLFLWGWVSTWYRETWAKLAIAMFRAVSAGSAVGSKLASPKPNLTGFDQPWVATILIAVLGYFLWELTGVIGDGRFKKKATEHAQEIEALTQDLEDVELQVYRLGWLVTQLRELAHEKLQRVRRACVSADSNRVSIQKVREGLEPERQIRLILESLASLLRIEATLKQGGSGQNFRIGLFAEDSGFLVPVDAFDLATRSHEPFTSYQKYPVRFSVDNIENPSQAVRCVVEGRAIIVPDCANEASFDYFEDKQRGYLRSMVAYPLVEFCRDGHTPVRAALLLDTNVAGYFREEDREMIEMRIKEFVVRIDLEYAVGRLIG